MTAYLCQHYGYSVVYVALNQLLKEQVEEKVKLMSGLNCKVILEQSIGLHLAKETTFRNAKQPKATSRRDHEGTDPIF